MTNIAIDAGFYQSSVLQFSAQNCVNVYPVNPQNKGAISGGSLFSTPGLQQLFTVDGVGRVMAEYYTDKKNLLKYVSDKELLLL